MCVCVCGGGELGLGNRGGGLGFMSHIATLFESQFMTFAINESSIKSVDRGGGEL